MQSNANLAEMTSCRTYKNVEWLQHCSPARRSIFNSRFENRAERRRPRPGPRKVVCERCTALGERFRKREANLFLFRHQYRTKNDSESNILPNEFLSNLPRVYCRNRLYRVLKRFFKRIKREDNLQIYSLSAFCTSIAYKIERQPAASSAVAAARSAMRLIDLNSILYSWRRS